MPRSRLKEEREEPVSEGGRQSERGERERKRDYWVLSRERERNRGAKGPKEGEETHCHGGTHMTERLSSGEIKVRDREGKQNR